MVHIDFSLILVTWNHVPEDGVNLAWTKEEEKQKSLKTKIVAVPYKYYFSSDNSFRFFKFNIYILQFNSSNFQYLISLWCVLLVCSFSILFFLHFKRILIWPHTSALFTGISGEMSPHFLFVHFVFICSKNENSSLN